MVDDNLSDNEHSQDSKNPDLIKLAANNHIKQTEIKLEKNTNLFGTDIKKEDHNSDISDDDFFNGN